MEFIEKRLAKDRDKYYRGTQFETARELLPPKDRWSTIDLYLKVVASSGLLAALSKEHSDLINFSDGEIYQKICQYKDNPDKSPDATFAEKRAWVYVKLGTALSPVKISKICPGLTTLLAQGDAAWSTRDARPSWVSLIPKPTLVLLSGQLGRARRPRHTAPHLTASNVFSNAICPRGFLTAVRCRILAPGELIRCLLVVRIPQFNMK
ncbi:hypothetical protein MMC31_002501 [Peltigera leucophlebia]|nr:hypothetical protein [Peltigera leucophlebia]